MRCMKVPCLGALPAERGRRGGLRRRRAAQLARPVGATTVDHVEAVRVVVEVEELVLAVLRLRGRGVPTAPGGQADGGRADHHHEAEDTEPDLLGDRATHEHRDADDEDDGRGDRAHARHAFQGAPTQRGDELGVLLGKRLLHLLQQTEFLFGERHDFLPQ